METKTFYVYPSGGKVFSVELTDFQTDGENLKPPNADKALSLLSDKLIDAIYHPNEPPTDWRLVAAQPRLFKVYLRQHTKSPLKIHAHYFKVLDSTLEFYYTSVHEASGPGGVAQLYDKDEKVNHVYIKRSEVVAIVSSEPLPAPPQP